MATVIRVLEVTNLSGRGWTVVGHPLNHDQAIALATTHGDGLYCWTRQDAFTKALQSFILISGGVIVMTWGPTDTIIPTPPQPSLPAPSQVSCATIEEAAEEFSRKCYKILIPAALKRKLELVFDDADAYAALHKAIPDLPWKPNALAKALTEAWVERFGDGVILRDGGDIAILTAKVKTISEIRQFLRGFAAEYLKAHSTTAA